MRRLLLAVLLAVTALIPMPASAAPTPPHGPAGTWTRVFTDNFDGTSLDRSKWALYCKTMNGVRTRSSNITVSGGVLSLRLSGGTGATISTSSLDWCGDPTSPFSLPVGGVAEARVLFPANSQGTCTNWPAWWASGPNWPSAGEHDIAEVLGGQLSTNYHYGPSWDQHTASHGPRFNGWCGGWHTYTLHRLSGSARVYWDGRLIREYATHDNGQPEALILTIGTGRPSSSQPLRVDYVRAWR